MLFNSYAFIFFFLPVALLVFFQLGKASSKLAAGWLAAASVFLYGWWNPACVGLLAVSILLKYAGGHRPCRLEGRGAGQETAAHARGDGQSRVAGLLQVRDVTCFPHIIAGPIQQHRELLERGGIYDKLYRIQFAPGSA